MLLEKQRLSGFDMINVLVVDENGQILYSQDSVFEKVFSVNNLDPYFNPQGQLVLSPGDSVEADNGNHVVKELI